MPKVAIQGDLFSQAPAAVPGRAAQELAPVVNSTSFDPKKANYRTANT